ncbi:3'-_5' exoribonuclease Bsu YhaM [hydrothermal vent metagenome]|uniref:3'->5' exoribonuclease Bsu YhaM n=1 Tax=hydrothermal vent metagenome TaxID=652676 RepID=A0A3B1DVT4_9ZZZZ
MRAFSELIPGEEEECFVLLASKEAASTRDGKPYYRVKFRDKQRSATAMVWSDSTWFAACDNKWKEGAYYFLRCTFTESKYGPQLDLDFVRPVTEEDKKNGFDASNFFATSRFDVETMFEEIVEIAQNNITEEPLQQLVITLLNDRAEEIKKFPAASRNHHAFSGGFLEHTLSVTKTALMLAQKYVDYYTQMHPPLSVSLVVAGAILHDIGKLIELNYRPNNTTYSARGQLVGHILLGRDIVREQGATIENLSPETLLRLEHIIISHQNLPEWGSPIAPHTPEALLVHYADDIDAKFQMMAAVLEVPSQNEAEFTGRDNPMRRSIFRGLQPE